MKNESGWSWKIFSLSIFLVYLFALAVRYIWIDWASQFPEFFWNGQLMINTNDGYYWAEGARDILAGGHQPHDLSPVNAPISKLTAFLSRILPVQFETVVLWMPAVFGSLIVVPIMLIARELKQELAGFVAALLGGIVWSYYNRTMVGYYDTDMLTIVLPAFVLWGVVMAVGRKRNRFMVLTALMMVLYQWWYSAAYPLNTALAGMVSLYTLIFERKALYNYKLLLFMLLALMPVGWLFESAAVVLAYLFFHFGGKKTDRAVWPLLAVAVVAFVAMGGLAPVWYQVKGYLLRESLTGEGTQLHFYAVNKTVREAGKISFELFANRISGSSITFILSMAGYLMLAWRYRVMWLALPMVGLGFLAMKGGLRFTVYAVPVMALGIGYLATWFAGRIASYASTPSLRNGLKYGTTALLTLAILYPNIVHAIGYRVPTVFTKPEVEVLAQLGKIAGREDYVLTWWDYGYPIRYYGDVKTLVDGGKHTGDVNFPVSFALTRPQIASANMARLDTEYTETAYNCDRNGSYLQMMMEDYEYRDPEKFLKALDDPSFKLPKKSRDVYYYLPLRMLDIFPTVSVFSFIDLDSGAEQRRPFMYMSRQFKNTKNELFLGNNIVLDKARGIIKIGSKQFTLNSFVTTALLSNNTVESSAQTIDPSSPFYLIFMKSYNRFLLLDETLYNSTFIQLFVLGKYNAELFEPIIITPMAMVYRLKR